jgi:hypothetical protein
MAALPLEGEEDADALLAISRLGKEMGAVELLCAGHRLGRERKTRRLMAPLLGKRRGAINGRLILPLHAPGRPRWVRRTPRSVVEIGGIK